MSEEIFWDLDVAILPGKLEDFRTLAQELIAATEPEPGTLSYEWRISEDGTACHIYERYKDSAAVLTHVRSFGSYAERFMQACRPTGFQVCGAPSEEVKAALADFHPVYYSKLGGFNR